MAYELNQAQRNWIAALRSGDYKQAIGLLHDHETGCMCCLGVAASQMMEPDGRQQERVVYDTFTDVAPPLVIETLKLRTSNGTVDLLALDPETEEMIRERVELFSHETRTHLTTLNDTGGFTFTEIADFVEANPEAVFTC